jgi:hypothetical protein
MNIKRGLKRLWVVGSVLWVIVLCVLFYDKWNTGRMESFDFGLVFGFPLFMWILLYMGFWVSSGFKDKNKDETNE